MAKSRHVKISKRKSRRVRRGGAAAPMAAAFVDALQTARDNYLEQLNSIEDKDIDLYKNESLAFDALIKDLAIDKHCDEYYKRLNNEYKEYCKRTGACYIHYTTNHYVHWLL